MSSPDLTPILEDLAAGRIDAAEASRRIEELKATAAEEYPEPTDVPPAEDPEPGNWKPYARDSFNREEEPTRRRTGANAKGVERVSIRAFGRRVRVIGDPKVATVSVDGAHVLRRNGSVLEITSEGDFGPSIDGFALLRNQSFDVKSLGIGKELAVRANPDLVVDAELTAGSLTTEQIAHLGKVRVTAGGAKLNDVQQAEDILVQTGQATLNGRFTVGRSRVRCESGSLTVNLDNESNVSVYAEAQLGRISWSGQHSGAGDEVVMGNGSARLDVGVVMGHAAIKVGEEQAQ